ncbi:hypothetical protein [Corynebacterium neomassiliense]|uniref:hypothetical protein n=1 Tax=Corynebacterium neomassiliense TaxID=2079482 RepID=UPI0010324263|nr:hypothetical protein [Corynebacterium neomassiliense]
MSDRTLPAVIFFGHGPVADQVRRSLTDLATMGLTDRFFWIDPRLPTTAASVRLICTEPSVITLDAALRSITGSVLLVALDVTDDSTPGTPGLDFASVEKWTADIDARLFGKRARVRVILPRLPRTVTAPVPNPSWPAAVALAPEDSRAPMTTLQPVLREGDPTAVARTAAPALCGLTGLWGSATVCPLLDDEGRPISTGDIDQVRLARSFHRIVDASAVEDELRRDATDIRRQLPQPVMKDGRQLGYIGAGSGVPEDMADRLVEQYRNSLESPLQPEVSARSSSVVWYRALAGFLRKYFSEGLGSPRSWARAAVAAAHSSAAGIVQGNLYGKDSPVRVIADPAESPGRDLSLDQMAQESHRFQKALGSGIRVGADPQLADMWNGYRNVALTLVDGAEREQGTLEAPRDAYGNRRIVEQGWQSVPDVDDSFRGFHPLLGQRLGMTESEATIEPFDARKAADYEQGLNFVVGQTQEPTVRQLQQSFLEWKKVASRSYAWHTGENISALIAASRQTVTTQVTRLDEYRRRLGELQGRDTEKARHRHRRNTLWHLGLEVLLIAFVVLSVVIHEKPEWQPDWYAGFDYRWGLLWLVVGSLALMVSHMNSFATARRGIEKYLHDRHLAEENARIADINVRTAMTNLERQIGAYRQLLSWSTLLGRAISRPLGRDLSRGSSLRTPQSGLPLSTGIGRSVISGDRQVPLVTLVRREMFPPQWADRALDTLLADTAASVEQHRGIRPPALSQLASQSGAGTGSSLDLLSGWAVGPEMENRDRTREHWARVLSSPNSARALSQMVDTVTFFDNGVEKQTTKDEFLAILDHGDATAGSFLMDAVDPVASGSRATETDPVVCRLDRSDNGGDPTQTGTLTRSATLTQFGRVMSLRNLAADAADAVSAARLFPGTADRAAGGDNPAASFPGSFPEPQPGSSPDSGGRRPDPFPLPEFPGGDSLI